MIIPQFIRGISLLLILNFLVKPVWIFLIDRKVQLVVGNEAYGTYFSLLAIGIILNFVADAGISSMVNRRLAANEMVAPRAILITKVMLVLIFFLSCLMAGYLLGVHHWPLFLTLVAVQAATSLFLFFRSIIAAHQQFITDAMLSVMDKSLMIIFCAGFLYGVFEGFNLLVFVRLQLLATTVALLAAIGIVWRGKLLPGKNRSVGGMGDVLQQTAPFALIIFFMALQNRGDGIILQQLHSSGHAGIFAAAYRILDAANVGGYLVASFLLPFFARHRHHTSLVRPVLMGATAGLLPVAVVLAAFVSLYGTWTYQVLYRSADPYAVKVMQVLLWALPAYFTTHIYGTLLTALGRYKTMVTIFALAATTNLLLNYLLVPWYGAFGAAAISLATQSAAAISLSTIAMHRDVEGKVLISVKRSIAAASPLVVLAILKVFATPAPLALVITAGCTAAMLLHQMLYFRKNFLAHA